jgi:7-carboxy-7-deazaguanine synthase
MNEVELVNEAAASKSKFIVLTGGEPAIHNLKTLSVCAELKGIPLHIETSGAYPLQGTFQWITVSPKDKWAKPALESVVRAANEFKLIIEEPADIPYWNEKLFFELNGAWMDKRATIWLHPEWSKRNDPAILKAITHQVKFTGDPWRAGYQLHKLFRADALDNRTQPLAPLGGNPELGY